MKLAPRRPDQDRSLLLDPRRAAEPRLGHLAAWLITLAALVALASGCDVAPSQLPSYHKGYAPKQPIAYSHKVHAGDLKIDCKYCHFGSEMSRHAGIPPLNVCMNCHKQNLVKPGSPELKKLTDAYEKGEPIHWVKIHHLPDFVSFDHSRHVNRGVACQTCHGPIQTMEVVAQANTLAMGWCVNCHREYNANPPAEMADTRIIASTDCYACHH